MDGQMTHRGSALEAHVEAGFHLVEALDMELEKTVFRNRGDELVVPSAHAFENVEMEIDADVFRPSALMDKKLEEEYSTAFCVSSMLQEAGRFRSQFVDIEQVLLSEDHTAHAPYPPPSFIPAQSITVNGVFSIGQKDKASELPPKYFRGVHDSPCKTRVHRRTFGSFNKTFAFCGGSESTKRERNRSQSARQTPKHRDLMSEASDVDITSTFVPTYPGLESLKQELLCTSPRFLQDDMCMISQENRNAANAPVSSEPEFTAQRPEVATPTVSTTCSRLNHSISPTMVGSKIAESKRKLDHLDHSYDACAQLSMPVDMVLKSEPLEHPSVPFKFQLLRPSASQATNIIQSSHSPIDTELPPRYFCSAVGSPQKRRAHSTTFGAFGRSFSFGSS